MGNRVGKRKRLGVADKATDQKVETASVERDGTLAETTLDTAQVMGKAHCTEKPAPGTTEETQVQTAREHGEAQSSVETTEVNESQSDAQMPQVVPQNTEAQLDTETSEHTSEAQPVVKSALGSTDKTEAAMEQDESSPIGEATQVTETHLNALDAQKPEAQFADEAQPVEMNTWKTEAQPSARSREEIDVPVTMATMQVALRESEPAAPTPQMNGEAESITETPLVSIEVVGAQLSVPYTHVGEMQLAEMGESQKARDDAEALSTAEQPVEVTEAPPTSTQAHESRQDTDGSQPLAEKTLETAEVSEGHTMEQTTEETREGQQIAQAIEAEVCSIEETAQKATQVIMEPQSAVVSTGVTGGRQSIEPTLGILEMAESQNVTEISEAQPAAETTERTKTQPITLDTQEAKVVAEGQPVMETTEVIADSQPTALGKPDSETHKTAQILDEIGEGQTALLLFTSRQSLSQDTLHGWQSLAILEEIPPMTGETQLLAVTETVSVVPNTQTLQDTGAWPSAEITEAAEVKSTEQMALDTAKVSEAQSAGENQVHLNTGVTEVMEVQATGSDTQESPQKTETMRETGVTQSTEWSMPEGGGALPTAEEAQAEIAASIAQKAEPATEIIAANSESCPIAQATEEMEVPLVAEIEVQMTVPATQERPQDTSEMKPIRLHVPETDVQLSVQQTEVYTTALTMLKIIRETSEAAAETTEENEACPSPGMMLETTEEAESLQSLIETIELRVEKRDQDPPILANITEDQEAGGDEAGSKEEALKASEAKVSAGAEPELQQCTKQEDPADSLDAGSEFPQKLEPSSETQAFQPLAFTVTVVDGVQGEVQQAPPASETQKAKGEMALSPDCGPIGSEAVPSKGISGREAPDLVSMA
ncbi:mucin-22-like [Emydura macquarii macquarii]|uniref:mucin-22-like n=1 Tax=Emydura macquarii macquarii TaxID=1129001 RepID=UPI003529DE6B